MVKIRAYNASSELDIEAINTPHRDSFTLGTRILLTCDVTGLPEGSEIIRYKWYRKCAQMTQRCEIEEGAPYYRVVDDTLLLDVISHTLGKRFVCEAEYHYEQNMSDFASIRINIASEYIRYNLNGEQILSLCCSTVYQFTFCR